MKRDNSTYALALLIIVVLGWTLFYHDSRPSNPNKTIDSLSTDSLHIGLLSDSSPVIAIDSSRSGVIIYYPPTDSVDLRCIVRPVPEIDSNIVFCCAAAFTGKGYLGHGNIAGDHVSSGRRYKGYRCDWNTGAIVFYNGRWEFIYKDYSHKLDSAVANHGAGFAQEMMIHKGKQVETKRSLSDTCLFRALCEIGGRLCIVDASDCIQYGDFINSLLEIGVTEALYTDMGKGWNYSWYRKFPRTKAHFIHAEYEEKATNWLVFID